MKTVERIPILANVLNAVCKRPSVEVGKLVKAVVKYVNEGTVEPTGSERLDAYLELIVIDLEMQQKSADEKSRKCSESAKCRTARSSSTSANAARKANAAFERKAANAGDTDNVDYDEDADGVTDADDAGDEGSEQVQSDLAMPRSSESVDVGGNDNLVTPSECSDFNASDVTSSFARMKSVYGKTGNNESQALEIWKRLTENERTAAFAHAQRMQGSPVSRDYLYVYLKNRGWTKTDAGK